MKLRAPLMISGPLISGLALLALAGCHNAPTKKTDNQRTAEGQVLKGSISDAMLPYDAVTSEPPVAAPRASAAPDAGEADAPGAPAEAAPTAEAAPAPAGSSDTPAATASPAA